MGYILLFLLLMAVSELLSENLWIMLIFIIIVFFFIIIKGKRNKKVTTLFSVQNTQPSSLYTNVDYNNLDGHQFEVYCAEILKKNNFSHISITKGSGDFGVDILAEKNGYTYAIQCKNYSSKVGNHAVQEVYSGKDYYNADIAVVIASNYFTPAAVETADNLGVELWDKDKLNSMINAPVTSSIRSDVTLKNAPKISGQIENASDEIANVTSPTGVEIQNAETHEKETITMYNEEKGIYPSGEYIIGEDLPIGKYILRQRESSINGEIHIYKDYQTYLKNPDNELIYKTFKEDYHLSLRTVGNLLVVEGADMQKI